MDSLEFNSKVKSVRSTASFLLSELDNEIAQSKEEIRDSKEYLGKLQEMKRYTEKQMRIVNFLKI